MFRFCKKLIIWGILLLIVGVGITGGLFASGAIDDIPSIPPNTATNHYETTAISLVEISDNYTDDSNLLFQSSDESITDIDVYISSGSFSIVTGDEFSVTAYNADVSKIAVIPDGEKLSIEYKRDFLETLSSDPAAIVLTVPLTTFKNISIEMDAGQMYISGYEEPEFISADKLDISLNAGELTMDSMNVEDFSLDMSAGDAFITDLTVSDKADINVSMGECTFFVSSLANAVIDQSAGNMYFNDCALTGDTKIDMSMGDMQFSGMIRDNTNIDMSAGEIYMSVTGFASEYSVITDRSAGTVFIDGDEKAGRHTESVVDDPLGTINIDISAGDCEINFTEG